MTGACQTMAMTRISDSDHRVLQNLATQTGMQHQEIIHQALDIYQRERLLDDIASGFERLRSNPKAWKSEEEERALWDNATGDGID
jgi:hypothetical protein